MGPPAPKHFVPFDSIRNLSTTRVHVDMLLSSDSLLFRQNPSQVGNEAISKVPVGKPGGFECVSPGGSSVKVVDRVVVVVVVVVVVEVSVCFIAEEVIIPESPTREELILLLVRHSPLKP